MLVNSENLCSPKAKTHAEVNLTAQNGKVYEAPEGPVYPCAPPPTSSPTWSRPSAAKALAHFVGQNGKVDNFSPAVANSCTTKPKKRGGHKGHRR